MKKIIISLAIIGSLSLSSCNDWLELLPKNEQVTADFWKNKEEVESVLGTGYVYLRNTVPTLIDWSELRGSSIYSLGTKKQKLQNFQLTSSDDLCKWSDFYKVINIANSVLQYAPDVRDTDETYTTEAMNSHLTEAYFLRAYTYFTLVRNFKEVPMPLISYTDDSAPFNMAKSSESALIEQIKSDITTALATGAAKTFFDDDEWTGASKGRATKWALYALMADVCLWNEDYDECIEYADLLINATDIRRPAFMQSSNLWFEIFYPGNSNESIFELNYGYEFGQADAGPSIYFTVAALAPYQYTSRMRARLLAEKNESEDPLNASVRAEWGAYAEISSNSYCIWKYQGAGGTDLSSIRTRKDGNYILYRMADVMLMKAEALTWKGEANYAEAIAIVNQIRNRVQLADLDLINPDEVTLLKAILHERDMELAAEGKRWYDLMRFGKSKNYKYKTEFIAEIVANAQSAKPSWIRSVLSNEWAWYLPVSQSEMDVNELLTQNPYYGGTSN